METFKLLMLMLWIFTPSENATRPTASTTLTLSVIKPPLEQAVSQFSEGGYNVSFRLVAVAGTDTVIDKIFTQKYKQGGSLTILQSKFVRDMQLEIDAFQAKHTIYNTAVFNNAATNIKNALNGAP